MFLQRMETWNCREYSKDCLLNRRIYRRLWKPRQVRYPKLRELTDGWHKPLLAVSENSGNWRGARRLELDKYYPIWSFFQYVWEFYLLVRTVSSLLANCSYSTVLSTTVTIIFISISHFIHPRGEHLYQFTNLSLVPRTPLLESTLLCFYEFSFFYI